MSDSDNKKPTLGRKPLGVKRTVDAGQVQQSFSHGRKNTVVVEVKRRRMIGKPGDPAPTPAPAPEPAPAPKAETPAPKPAPAPAPRKPSDADATLSRKELQEKLLREAEGARLNQLEDSRRREDNERNRAADEEKRRADENRKAEQSQADAEAEAEATPQVEVREEPDISAPEPATDTAKPGSEKFPPARKFTPIERKAPEPKRPERTKERADHKRRQSGKLTVTRALEGGDGGARARSLAALKRAREKEKRAHSGPRTPQPKQTREVIVPEAITVQELSKRMGEKGAELVKTLFKMDMMVTVNQTIDADTAELLVEEFGHIIKRVSEADIEIDTERDVDPEETLKPRAPVVTIMGHVDHGKTSLLDALRGTDVVAGEAGGITQHIGAYRIKTKSGNDITFLDTPGHEAFTEMRARGANVTDIVILVVAADDGLMPQTIEAIAHTKAAGVPMIVAINKIDKDGANPQKVRERLLEHEVIVEAMSGDVQDVEVSALKKTNLDKLVDAIDLQAELLELKANPDRAAEGNVIEARLDKGRGPVATVLVNRGTLKVGDVFVVGTESGRVRALVDDKGKQIKQAGPATPVEVLGLGGVPSAGDMLTVVENEARAREVAAYRQEQAKKIRTATAPANLDTMFSALADKANVIEYPVVVKADVQGSVEAIVNALNKISTDDIKVRVLHSGVGGITESDVTLASASNAPIIGFNVRPNPKARQIVAREKTRLKYFDVIYDLTDDIRKEMAGELGPEFIETVVGRAEVKDVFPAGKKDKAAGLLVSDGVIKKGLHARLTRDDVIVSKTVITSLRRFKDDVAEVRAGMECGVLLEDTNDIKAGDMLEVFEIEERERTL